MNEAAMTSIKFNARSAGQRGGTATVELTTDSSTTGVNVGGDVESAELGEKGK